MVRHPIRLAVSALLMSATLFGQSYVAVIDLSGHNVSGEEASALTDRLRIEIFNTGNFRVLERELMEKILDEQGFQQSECTSNECLVEVGQLIGVEMIIGGSVGKVGDVFSVSARIVSVETGEMVKTATFDYEGKIGELLRIGMHSIAYQLAGRADELSTEMQALLQQSRLYPQSHQDPSYNQKMHTYESMDKNATLAGFLSFFLPSTGHLYAGNWKRSLPFLGARVAALLLANNLGTVTEVYNEETGEMDNEYDTIYSAGMIVYLAAGIWEISDAVKLVKAHNQKIYDNIFGAGIDVRWDLIPQPNAVTLQLSCSF